MLYSDYCKYAPQVRYGNFDGAKKQMYKLHKKHREAGYITKIDYYETTDSEGKTDWEMLYTPGPKAFAEYQAFTNRQLPQLKILPAPRSGQGRPVQASLALTVGDSPLLAELTKRGIAEPKARELLANLKPGQEVMDQLEYVDSLVANDRKGRGKLENPPGLYVMYVRDNTATPTNFQSSRKTRLRDEASQAKNAELASMARLQIEYDDYREAEVLQFTESLDWDEHEKLFAAKRLSLLPMFRGMTSQQLDNLTSTSVRDELQKSGRVPLMSFEEFCQRGSALAIES